MRRLSAILSLASLVAVAIVTVGCGPQCSYANKCFVDGQPPNITICDGNNWQSCGPNENQGVVIPCNVRNENATCGPGGWSFQPNGPSVPVDGGP